MIAVKFSEDDKYGCPNCGCDRWYEIVPIVVIKLVEHVSHV